MTTIEALPPEVVVKIAQFLPSFDMLNFLATNRRHNEIIERNMKKMRRPFVSLEIESVQTAWRIYVSIPSSELLQLEVGCSCKRVLSFKGHRAEQISSLVGNVTENCARSKVKLIGEFNILNYGGVFSKRFSSAELATELMNSTLKVVLPRVRIGYFKLLSDIPDSVIKTICNSIDDQQYQLNCLYIRYPYHMMRQRWIDFVAKLDPKWFNVENQVISEELLTEIWHRTYPDDPYSQLFHKDISLILPLNWVIDKMKLGTETDHAGKFMLGMSVDLLKAWVETMKKYALDEFKNNCIYRPNPKRLNKTPYIETLCAKNLFMYHSTGNMAMIHPLCITTFYTTECLQLT